MRLQYRRIHSWQLKKKTGGSEDLPVFTMAMGYGKERKGKTDGGTVAADKRRIV